MGIPTNSVGSMSETLAGDDANHFFRTAPTTGTLKQTRVWVLGDSGTGDGNAIAVRDSYYGFGAGRHTDLWLMLGDNAYPSGTDDNYQTKMFEIFPEVLRRSVPSAVTTSGYLPSSTFPGSPPNSRKT